MTILSTRISRRALPKSGYFALFGLEIIALIDDLLAAGIKINDPGNPGKMYICGKGITKFAPLSSNASQATANYPRQ